MKINLFQRYIIETLSHTWNNIENEYGSFLTHVAHQRLFECLLVFCSMTVPPLGKSSNQLISCWKEANPLPVSCFSFFLCFVAMNMLSSFLAVTFTTWLELADVAFFLCFTFGIFFTGITSNSLRTQPCCMEAYTSHCCELHLHPALYSTAFENMPNLILQKSKGLWEMVPSHSEERDRLEVISSSHLIQSLTFLCSLIHFVVYQEERSIKALGRWHMGESNTNTLSLWERLQPTVK